jgi:indolepyruvate ferredoxin oxidoreductase beta subunit
MKNLNFLIAGVGGQGTILASDIMAEVGMMVGYDVKKTDVLGLAIRGGSVISHIRWGEKVDAPMSMRGKADYLLAFEPIEALRQIEFLNGESTIVFNEYKISPVTVSSGLATYPSDDVIDKTLKNSAKKICSLNATSKAVEIGSVKAMNIMMLGALSPFLDISTTIWEKAIKKFVPERFKELNLKAFHVGREIMKKKENFYENNGHQS